MFPSIQNKSGRKASYFTAFLTVLQCVCIIATYILHILSKKSVGVNHHVVAQKYFYLKNMLHPTMRHIYAIIIFVAIICILNIVVKKIRQKSYSEITVYISLTLILLVLGVELVIMNFQKSAIYVYLILCSLLVCFIQMTKIFIMKRVRTSNSDIE